MRNVITTLVLALALMFGPSATVAQQDGGEITVTSQYLTQDGDTYGVVYGLSSTVAGTVCIVPEVTESVNVTGGIGSVYELQQGENVRIGQFNRADNSRAWSVNVVANGHRGSC